MLLCEPVQDFVGAELYLAGIRDQWGALDSGVKSIAYAVLGGVCLMAQGIQIGKVAEQTGLSIDTIRFYQKIGLVKQPVRSEGGFRLFSETEIHDLVFIQKAQELGFSLTEIKQLSVLNQQPDHACSEVRGLLISKLKDVREKVNQLLRLEGELKKALRKCTRDLRSNKGSQHEDRCPVLETLERRSTKRR